MLGCITILLKGVISRVMGEGIDRFPAKETALEIRDTTFMRDGMPSKARQEPSRMFLLQTPLKGL